MSTDSFSEDHVAFEHAISHGMRFWRNQSASSGDRRPKRVLVDLLVDHPVYYLGNLVLAKYFELTRGLKPWALVSSASDRKIILLARSFGIDQFTFVRDEVVKEARAEAAGVLAQFEGHSGHELRRRVLGLNINGLSVGDLLYDTFLRETRRVTMEQVDDDLRAYTILLFNYYALYGRLLSDEDVDVVVMGHLVYLRFGVLARMAAAGGAEVAARYGGKGMRVQLRNNVTGVTDVMTRIKPSMVDKILFTEGDKAASIGRQTLVRRMSGIGNEFKYLNEEGYSPDRQKLSSRGLTEVLGLKAGRSRGLLMLHAFPDANHFSPGLLFDDFYDWYRQTVAAIVEMPNTDWLIKLHPNLSHYTDDTSPVAYAAEMARRYEHLHLVPDGLNTASLAEFTDFLITVNGKAGLEFAGCGVPVILAGKGFFSGNGFSEEPGDIEEYKAALEKGPKLGLSTVASRRALVANDLFYRRLIVDCKFLLDTPYNFWKPFNEGEFWRYYVASIRSGGIEEDALFKSMLTAREQKSDTLLRPG